jgi:hypothetical protein
VADHGCDFTDEGENRCGKKPSVVSITKTADQTPDLGIGHLAGVVETVKHYCGDHLPSDAGAISIDENL